MPRTVEDSTLHIGQRLTDGVNFDTIVEHVAYGGFSVIVTGPNALRNDQMTAYKTLRRDLLNDPQTRASFVRECLLWNSLWPHPNISSAYATIEMYDETGPRPFLALEYAEYGSLRDLLRAAARREPIGRFPVQHALTLAQQIAAGLAYLHRPDPAYLRNDPTVHRDMKPENVLLMSDGRAALTDFGLAKVVEESPLALAMLLSESDMTNAGQSGVQVHEAVPLEGEDVATTMGLHTGAGVALGTIAYMPPEQWQDARSVGPAADIYGLGIMLSEMLAGRHALLDLSQRHSMDEWRRAHRNPQPMPLRDVAPDVPEVVETIYQRCLAPDPADRPSADEVLATLQAGARTIGADVYKPTEMASHTPFNEFAYWHTSAIAYLTFEKYEEALGRIDRALTLRHDAWDALNTRGNILASMALEAANNERSEEALKWREQALQAYHASLEVMPSGDTAWQKTAWSNIGGWLSMSGQFAEADGVFVQALAANPSFDATLQRALNYRYWAMAEFEQGRIGEATRLIAEGIAAAERATGMDPTNPRAQKLLAALRLFASARLGQTV